MLTMLVAPAVAFEHPPPPPEDHPPCTYFAVLINGQFAKDLAHNYTFIEPGQGYCTNFNVTVAIYNVTDLYGYDFWLWWNAGYFELLGWKVEMTWASNTRIIINGTSGSWYHQVVTALAPATGVDGDFTLVTLTFHIINDACWLQDDNVWDKFYLSDEKASNSCSGKISLCAHIPAYWQIKPVKPKIKIVPADEVNNKVGDKWTASVIVENMVKMTDLYIYVSWNGFKLIDEPFWNALLCTAKADVVTNTVVMPTAKRTTDLLTVVSPPCNVRYTSASAAAGYVALQIVMDPTYPLINGTFWIMNITFTKCDPWFCGAQPRYTIDTLTHAIKMENASTPLCIGGSFSVKCGQYTRMDLPTDVTVENGKYTFLPKPGDLNGDGIIDIADLLIIAKYYGLTNHLYTPPGTETPPAYPEWYMDLNKDGIVDIFDVVIVAKNIGS